MLAFAAAPAIVRASSLMPVKPTLLTDPLVWMEGPSLGYRIYDEAGPVDWIKIMEMGFKILAKSSEGADLKAALGASL